MLKECSTTALQMHLRKRVRAIARDASPCSEELFTIAAGPRKAWTLAEWQDVLSSLDACDDTVEDWLAINYIGE